MPSITIWTRLEPRCRTADMAPALEARTHDPFWMLARQWQLGELLGDDAGSPIIAAIDSVDIPLDRYAGLSGSTTTLPMSTHLWVARRKQPGALVGSSGLQFDRLDSS
jgi:hypothetical protein